MAAVAAGAGVAARSGRGGARGAGPAGPRVAVRDPQRRARAGMGLAPPAGPALQALEIGTPAGLPETARPPAALRARVRLAPLRDALAAVHRPASLEDAERGRRRLAFDEFFDQQLVQARARVLAKRARAGIRFELKRELTTRLKETLPFELTGDQKHAVREITEDMTAAERMHRLLMGDVGTGKTVVALFAMLLAAENAYQP